VKLEKGSGVSVSLEEDESVAVVEDLGEGESRAVGLSVEQLRWLCVVAGPALLFAYDREHEADRLAAMREGPGRD
jgi:hypothetical protein